MVSIYPDKHDIDLDKYVFAHKDMAYEVSSWKNCLGKWCDFTSSLSVFYNLFDVWYPIPTLKKPSGPRWNLGSKQSEYQEIHHREISVLSGPNL